MANFDNTARVRINSATDASIVVQSIQITYRNAKQAKVFLDRYTAGTDQPFNAAVNAMFTSAERSELAQMLTQLNNLIADWEANHAAVLSV